HGVRAHDGFALPAPSARALGWLAVGVRSSRNRPRTRRSRHGPIADAPGLGEARRGPPLMASRGQGPRSASEYRGAPTAEHGCSERWGVWGAMSGPPIFLHGEGLELQAPEQPCAVLIEPLPRGVVAEPKRRATGLEAHRGPEERRLRQRGLDQEELGPRVLH